VAAQSLLESSVNFLDTFMIGQLGEVPLAAVALGNQIYFIALLMLFGISSGVGIFVSQYWGQRDVAGIRRVMGISITFSLSGAVLISAVAALFPRAILGIFTEDPRVIAAAVQYLRIAVFSYPLTALAINFAMGLRSCGQTRLPLLATAIGLGANALLNYLLIFGKLGIPAMGIRGAALGTVIARGIQAGLIVVFAYAGRHAAAGRPAELFGWDRRLFHRVMKTALPVIANEIGWSIGVSLFNAVFARISTEVLAARNIADTVFRLLLVIFIGMGTSCYIMIGNAIGARKPEEAAKIAANFSWLAPATGIAAGVMLASLSPVIPRLFRVAPTTLGYARDFLIVISLLYPFKALSLVQIVGILRAGGDTRFSLLLDVGGVWLIGLPLAFISGLVLHWPPVIVFFLASSEEIFKTLIGIRRTISGRWINDLTVSE
jgi:putative MATE family efflux protein